MHLVLITEVVICHEKADLDPGSAHILLRSVGEEQAGGPFETVLFDQFQVAENHLPVVAQYRSVHASACGRTLFEQPQGRSAAGPRGERRLRSIIPVASPFLQQESLQCRPLQLLLGAAAAIVILPLVTDRTGIRRDADFDTAGPSTEAAQSLNFVVTSDNPALFDAEPSISASGLATVTMTVTAPTPPATKFFVVDDGNKVSFQYAADGSALSSTSLNKSDSKPRGIASNAPGTTQWVIDGSGNVFVYGNAGTLLGEWTPQNVGKPEGISVWENDLWIVDPNQDRVFFFAGGAALRADRVNPTSSFALSSGNLNSTDLVTDGSHLWVVNDTATTDKVFRYSVSGTLEGSWTISPSNSSPSGITIDPSSVNHIWIVDASTDRVYQYDGASGRLTGSQEPSKTFALAASNTSPQGIADPLPATAASQSAPIDLVRREDRPHREVHHRSAIDHRLIDDSIRRLFGDATLEAHKQVDLVSEHKGNEIALGAVQSAASWTGVSPNATTGVAINDAFAAALASSSRSRKDHTEAVDEVFAELYELP